MTRFAAIPNIPTGSEMADWQSNLLSKVVENTELLTGLRGESDRASVAVTKDDSHLYADEHRCSDDGCYSFFYQ